MNSAKRELADALVEIADLYPDWRMGQLVANVAAWAGEDEPASVWEVSDEQMLAAARKHLARGSTQTSGTRR